MGTHGNTTCDLVAREHEAIRSLLLCTWHLRPAFDTLKSVKGPHLSSDSQSRFTMTAAFDLPSELYEEIVL